MECSNNEISIIMTKILKIYKKQNVHVGPSEIY